MVWTDSDWIQLDQDMKTLANTIRNGEINHPDDGGAQLRWNVECLESSINTKRLMEKY